MTLGLDQLRKAGFGANGEWKRRDGRVFCDGQVPDLPGVYLFVIGTDIRYVGSALKSLARRMRSYERRQATDSSDRAVHAGLKAAIDGKHPVHVLTLSGVPVLTTCADGLPCNYLLGLESGLIETLNPAWNRRGRRLVVEEHEFNTGGRLSGRDPSKTGGRDAT